MNLKNDFFGVRSNSLPTARRCELSDAFAGGIIGYSSEGGRSRSRLGNGDRNCDRDGKSNRGVPGDGESVAGRGASGSVEADARNFLHVLAGAFESGRGSPRPGAAVPKSSSSLYSGYDGGFRRECRGAGAPGGCRGSDGLIGSAASEEIVSPLERRIVRGVRDASATGSTSVEPDDAGAAIEVRIFTDVAFLDMIAFYGLAMTVADALRVDRTISECLPTNCCVSKTSAARGSRPQYRRTCM